ncbi:MAG: hypothetical protein A2087_01570 [Spirochaetes bacterium GWD1_61_31]|nr:MAG: hypothetical protein A2Y37_12470 [Spirochaetes bacterium GWB1_60_80]OHD30183.1 MAG: hypothetical protein A2004_14335 [Spirochaetes bacterium GWC1_61_12]OHD35882.1 MAG: hypothetical protein A2087_01570 [Spirochaetes bacterium GWD1_61_31]OHD42157.1 MAG: hypothetical protein A2Y35_06465 [Spirochaetes bacterium GWE1_60_18]OHD59433.1 MAG: hypothetical protein A2Y32_09905 [Spirochaetes bacterium GWF1_60_12]HAP44054.1 hypothetical protein [Spirochaetaceae bacterium]
MKRHLLAACLLARIWLAALNPWSEAGQPDRLVAQAVEVQAVQTTLASLNITTILDGAATQAAAVLAARENLADAAEAYDDSLAWKDSFLNLSAGWKGNLDPAVPPPSGQDQTPLTASASLGLSLPANVELAAGTALDGSLAVSAAWSPLAADDRRELLYKLALAEIALQDAVKQARLAAADALVAFLTAEAELQAAGRSLERATLELTRWQTLQVRGETDRLSLLRAEAQQSGARNGLAKAQLTLARARRNLAAKAGADVATQIEAGAVIDGALEEPDDAWRLPDFQPERWHRTVAETAARQSFLTQTGRYTGNGPLTVSASLDAAGIVRLGASLDLAAITGFSGSRPLALAAAVGSDGSFSLSGSLILDWFWLSGRHADDRTEALADAATDYAQALEDARAAYDDAVAQLHLAEYSLAIARTSLAASQIDYQRSSLLLDRGEILAVDHTAIGDDLAAAELSLDLARLGVLRARLSLE